MATTPNYIAAPRVAVVQISTANTARDGTGAMGSMSVGAKGSKITLISATATGTTTAGMVRFFLFDGTTTFFWFEMIVDAITASATVSPWADGNPESISLPAGWQLRASTHNAETFNITMIGGDY